MCVTQIRGVLLAHEDNIATIVVMSSNQILGPVSLVYSYSHGDSPIRDRLEKHLAILKRLGLIETWHDHQIGPGEEWKAGN